jgi:hypothetical protein
MALRRFLMLESLVVVVVVVLTAAAAALSPCLWLLPLFA